MSIRKKVPTSGVKAHPDGVDYLSEVNTHNSDIHYRSDSEASTDFVASAKNLEHVFKHKFRVLRHAYEERLVNLSQIVETSCTAIINEDIAVEMRNDVTSLGYLPAHLAEVFNSHLRDEREDFLAETLHKLSALEFQVSRKDEIIDDTLTKMEKLEEEVSRYRHRELEFEPLRIRLGELEEQLKDLTRESAREIGDLAREKERLLADNEKLSAQIKDVNTTLHSHRTQREIHESDIHTRQTEFLELEKHCHRLEREVARMGEVDGSNEELHIKLKKCLQERDVLRDEVGEYRHQLKDAADELVKCQALIDEHVKNEEANKVKINNLMSQVDIVISQEANESSAAIEAAHAKMKSMRQTFIAELQEERKITLSLESQLMVSRDELQSRERTVKSLEADNQELRMKLEEIKSNVAELEKLVATTSSDDRHLKSLNAEIKLKNETLELRIHELERTKAQEIAQISDQIRSQIQKQYEIEKSQLDMRTSTLRMQFENELSVMQSHFKKSREVFESLAGDANNSTVVRTSSAAENLHYLSNVENENDYSSVGISKLVEQQQSQAMEVISVINHWQQVAADLTEQNNVFRQSIEKAGDNIRILRQMLEKEKLKYRDLQNIVDSKGIAVSNDLVTNNGSADGESAILRQQIIGLQRTISDLQSGINSKDTAINNLHRSYAQLQRSVEDSNNSISVSNQSHTNEHFSTTNNTNISGGREIDSNSSESLRRDNERLQSMYISIQRALTEKESTIHILEQTVNDLRQNPHAPSSTSEVAEAANEAQMKALADMKKRFQGLIETYEMSNTELEDELRAKIEQLSTTQADNEELVSRLSSVDRTLARVTEECAENRRLAFARQQSVLHLKKIIGTLESKIRIEMSEVKRAAGDVGELMKLLIANVASQTSKNKALIQDSIETAFGNNKQMQDFAVHHAQRELFKEHKLHEEALSEAFTSEMQKKSSEYSETIERTKAEMISHFDRAMMFGSSAQQYGGKSDLQSGLTTSEKAHFILVLSIKAVLDSLVSVSLIDSDFVVEIMQLISSSASSQSDSVSGDLKSVSAGLLATKIHKIMLAKLEETLQSRDTNGSVVSVLKSEIDGCKSKLDKAIVQASSLKKENMSLSSQLETTVIRLEKVNKDIATIKELHAVEMETLSQDMRDRLYSAQREYDSNVQSIRIDFIQKEADLKLRLDEAVSNSKDSSNSSMSILESKLKSEMAKRQTLANRLAAEESAHRNITHELEDRNAELLRRLESVELEFTKVKLEKLHHYGDEQMAEKDFSFHNRV